ncbi:MAG TPA: hypothetical protein VFE58_06630 [Tepidisphaeraceae bacterium]|jgi:hypothetical protein|nr:hypothetical protein [Tepidisphaeraceae bacterium]
MTQEDFKSALRSLAAGQLPAPPTAHAIARQLLRRDRRRTRFLAILSLLFWALGTTGLLWLVLALNRLVIFLRIVPGLPWSLPPRPGDLPNSQIPLDYMLQGTSLIHHSTPYIAAAIVCLFLAALFTVLLISSSRQATLNRINLSLAEIAEQLKSSGSATSSASSFQPPFTPPVEIKRSAFQSIVLLFLLLNLIAVDIAIVGTIFYAKTRSHIPLESATSLAWQGYPRLSPFHAVRYPTPTTIQVQIAGVWYELLAFNNLSTPDLIQACQSLDRKDWQKRFEEDLIEVLTRTNHAHPSLTTASLKLTNLSTHETTTQDIPMTMENRRGLWSARNKVLTTTGDQ